MLYRVELVGTLCDSKWTLTRYVIANNVTIASYLANDMATCLEDEYQEAHYEVASICEA